MTDNLKAMVMASFVADAISLGPHWIYDQEKIKREFGKIESLTAPLADSFHTTKSAGDFTHYGDQTIILLESIAHCGEFDLDHFAQTWQSLFVDYKGYVDKATKSTLENFKDGKTSLNSGSPSSDLAGAARIAPLIYLYRQNAEKLDHSVKAQTAMTHNNEMVIACARFFGAVTLKTLKGNPPTDAVLQIADEEFSESPLSMLVQKGYASRHENTCNAISNFGQMCDYNAAFSGVIHIISKYSDDFKNAMVENAMAGGDSAARGMLSAMILGGYLGVEAIPLPWLEQMNAFSKIEQLLSKIGGG